MASYHISKSRLIALAQLAQFEGSDPGKSMP
jgi:hypothetical protein